MRWVRAGVVAGLWACGAVLAMMVVLTFVAEGASWRSLASELAWAGPIYVAVALPLALALSLIGHLMLRGVGWTHPAAFVLCGAALGALAGAAMGWGKNPGVLIITCGVAGAAAGYGYRRAYGMPSS